MKTGEEIQQQNNQKSEELILTPDEKKRLVDFFAVLMDIDKRENITRFYDKPTK